MPLQKANSRQRLKQDIRSKQITTPLLQKAPPTALVRSMQPLVARLPATKKPSPFTTKHLSDENRRALLFFVKAHFILLHPSGKNL
jgi:hypothetical protein